MVIAEIVTMLIYIGSMWLLPTYFGESTNARYLKRISNALMCYRHVLHSYHAIRMEGCSDYGCKQLTAVCCEIDQATLCST